MEGIRPPGPFLAMAATASIPWSTWCSEIELYAVDISWSGWDPARQQALLLHCLGQEGRRRYRVAEAAAAGAAAPPPGTALAGGEAGDAAGRHDSRTRLKVMSYQVVSRCSENCLKSLVMPCLRD